MTFQPPAGCCVNSIAALRALGASVPPCVTVLGYDLPGDGGEGTFWYDASDTMSDDNGGTLIRDHANHCYKRITYGEEYSVRWFGAGCGGSSDDTKAFQACDTAAAAAGRARYVPGSVTPYRLSRPNDDTDNMIPGIDYCVNVTGANPAWFGDGQTSEVQLTAHANPIFADRAVALFRLNAATGHAVFRNLVLSSVPPVDHQHAGPIGITIGEMGANATARGSLESFTAEDVIFTNLSIATHGAGAKVIRLLRPNATQRGGGLSPMNDANLFNHGSILETASKDTYRTRLFELVDPVISMDATYGYHGVYLLGVMDTVSIRGITFVGPLLSDAIKFVAGPSTDPFWPSDFWQNITIIGGYITAPTNPAALGAILFSAAQTGAGICHNLLIEGITAADGNARFFYCEWAITNLTVKNNTARNTKINACEHQYVPRLSPANAGLSVYEGNNFNLYNTDLNDNAGIVSSGSSVLKVIANDLTSAGPAAGRCINNATNPTGSAGSAVNACTYAVGNRSDQLPLWLFDKDDTAYVFGVTDLGNSWTARWTAKLQSGWSTYAAPSARTPSYVLHGRQVRLEGMLTYSAAAAPLTDDTPIFTLPQALGPSDDIWDTAIYYTGTNVNQCRLRVASDGTVSIYNATWISSDFWVSLDGIGYVL